MAAVANPDKVIVAGAPVDAVIVRPRSDDELEALTHKCLTVWGMTDTPIHAMRFAVPVTPGDVLSLIHEVMANRHRLDQTQTGHTEQIEAVTQKIVDTEALRGDLSEVVKAAESVVDALGDVYLPLYALAPVAELARIVDATKTRLRSGSSAPDPDEDGR